MPTLSQGEKSINLHWNSKFPLRNKFFNSVFPSFFTSFYHGCIYNLKRGAFYSQNADVIWRFIHRSVIFILRTCFSFNSQNLQRVVLAILFTLIHFEQCNRTARTRNGTFPLVVFYNSVLSRITVHRGSPAYRREMAASIFPADGKLMPTPRGKHQLSPMRLEVNS